MRSKVKAKLEQIAQRRNCKVEEFRYIGFWGANNHIREGWLSQWHMHPITLNKGFTETMPWKGIGAEVKLPETELECIVTYPVDSIALPSAEHCMMYMKAMLFNDHDAMAEVCIAQTPAEAKAIGRKVKGYDNAKWDEVRYQVVKEINRIKFSSPEGLTVIRHFSKTSLGDRVVFVETSPYDNIWGIKSRECVSPELWAGDNLLGFAHTDVYDELVWGLK